jgi:hypothetical protein
MEDLEKEKDEKIRELGKKLQEKDEIVQRQGKKLQEKDEKLWQQDAELQEQKKENQRLREMLKANGL